MSTESLDESSIYSVNMTEKDYTVVNFNVVYDIISEWDSILDEFQANNPVAVQDSLFSVLESCDYTNGFPSKYDLANSDLINNIISVIEDAKSYFNELADVETGIKGLIPKDFDDEQNGGADDPADDGSSDDNNDGSGDLVDNSQEQLSLYGNLSITDMGSVFNTLRGLAHSEGKTIDELLTDATYADKIKELLLNNSNVPLNLRQLYETGSSVAVQTSLVSLLRGDNLLAIGLSEETKITMREYLSLIANSNDISLKDLISNPEYSELLNKTLTDMSSMQRFANSIPKESVQDQLLKIYDGDISNIDDTTMTMIRTNADVLSSIKKIPFEELVTNSTNAQDMYNSIQNLGKLSLYANTLSECSSATVIEMLNSIIG